MREWLLTGALVLFGCELSAQDPAVPSDPDGSGRGWVQSETSMARTFSPSGGPRLIVGYNDATEISDAAGNVRPDFSLLGLSVSDDFGATWTRRNQFTAGTPRIPALRGDPWVTAAGSLVLYVGLINPPGDGVGPDLGGDPDGVFLAVSRDGAETWEAELALYSNGSLCANVG